NLEERGVEQKPGEHLLVLHRLRDMVEGDEPRLRAAVGPWRRVKVDLPMAAEVSLVVDEIEEAAAEPAHGRNVDLAGPHHLPERQVEELGGAAERHGSVIDLQRHGADGGAMGDVEGVCEPFLVAVDHEIDITLPPACYGLGFVDAGLDEPERT